MQWADRILGEFSTLAQGLPPRGPHRPQFTQVFWEHELHRQRRNGEGNNATMNSERITHGELCSIEWRRALSTY